MFATNLHFFLWNVECKEMSGGVFTCGADYGKTMAFLKKLLTHEFMSSI